MTARWVVEEVQPVRDLTVQWQPISLLLKNDPPPDSPSHAPLVFTRNLLRVMESIRTTDGNHGVFRFYREIGTRIHQKGQSGFDPADAVADAGLNEGHAAAFDDPNWDAKIQERMDVGLSLAGTDVGTPIIGLHDSDGTPVGIFGPVISRKPSGEAALQLWDGFVAMATTPSFWELKRTRTEQPDFGTALPNG